MIRNIFVSLLVLSASSFAISKQDGVKLLAKSAQVLQKSRHSSLEFQVQVVDALKNQQNPQKGSLLLGPNNQFVLEMPGQKYYSDGITLWQYSEVQQQVLIKNIVDLDGAFHPSEVLFKYLQCPVLAAQRTQLQQEPVVQLSLDPRQQLKGFQKLTVWLNNSHLPVQILLHDTSDNIITYKISNVRTNVAVTAHTFKFPASDDVDEIDMR